MTAGSFVRILAKRGTNFCVRLDYIHGVSTVVVEPLRVLTVSRVFTIVKKVTSVATFTVSIFVFEKTS